MQSIIQYLSGWVEFYELNSAEIGRDNPLLVKFRADKVADPPINRPVCYYVTGSQTEPSNGPTLSELTVQYRR